MNKKIVFEYTHHAKYQMLMRKISSAAVEYTVLNPEETYSDSSDRSLSVAVRSLDGGGLIKVWYRFVDGEAVVLSCLVITVRRELPVTYTKAKKRKSKGKR